MKDFNYAGVKKLREELTFWPDESTLIVMAQNPSDNHHWSKPVGKITVNDLRSLLNIAAAALLTCEAEQERRA